MKVLSLEPGQDSWQSYIAVTMRVLGKQSLISIDHVSIERQATVPVVGDYPAV